MPYAEVLVLVAAVGVGVVGAALLLVGMVAAVFAGSATAGAASGVVVAVVLLSGTVATGTAGVVAAGAGMDAATAAGVETAGVVTGVGLETTNAAVTESESVPPPPPPPHAARDVATRVVRTRKVIVLNEVFISIYSELRSLGAASGSSLLASGIIRY